MLQAGRSLKQDKEKKVTKFEAIKPDLDLELITLTGEEVKLSPKMLVNSTVAIKITKYWSKLEDEQKELRKKNKEEDKKKETEGLSIMAVVTKELAYIYPKEYTWFLDNFDIPTLNDILLHVAEVIGGIKKKSKREKQ